MSRIAKILCVVGSVLLLVMAIFHGSGYSMVSDSIAESNAPAFIKHIVPALFLHTSMHLVGLAAFGFLALFNGSRGMIALLALAVLADAALAFHLGGVLAAVLLLVAMLCFAVAAVQRVPATSRKAA